MQKTANGKAVGVVSAQVPGRTDARKRTVTENELAYACNVHCNSAKEVVVTAEADECRRRYGTLELAESKNG